VHGQQLFFATREDLRPGLERIESAWRLEYLLHETRDDRNFAAWSSLLDAPGLGISRTGQCMTDDGYLVYPRDERPKVQSIPQRRGGMKYAAELSGSIVQFLPGGLHAPSGALVSGRVAQLVDTTERGIALYRDFSSAVLAGFRRVQRYWIGPEAYSQFQAGRRLATIGIKSPSEYDLVEPR
jgi:hypothetical protein